MALFLQSADSRAYLAQRCPLLFRSLLWLFFSPRRPVGNFPNKFSLNRFHEAFAILGFHNEGPWAAGNGIPEVFREIWHALAFDGERINNDPFFDDGVADDFNLLTHRIGAISRYVDDPAGAFESICVDCCCGESQGFANSVAAKA